MGLRKNPLILTLLLTIFSNLRSFASNVYDYDDPHLLPGRFLMVHLFEWKWEDIAKECEQYLHEYGYGAVQISPPTEHVWFVRDVDGKGRKDVPWYIRYQPTSYKLVSRSGDEKQLQDMINRCNKVGVRVVADLAINHMAIVNQIVGVNGVKSSGGSFFNSTDRHESFPAIPYSTEHFNDYRCTDDCTDDDYIHHPDRVRNCRLGGLTDLNQGDAHVRDEISGLLNKLIDMGVVGFRIDATKHMWPGDLEAIMDRLHTLRKDVFGPNKKPFVVQEVIDSSPDGAIKAGEYVHLGRHTNFNYGSAVKNAVRNRDNKNYATPAASAADRAPNPGFSGFPEAISPDWLICPNRDRYQSSCLTETKRLTYHTPGSERRRVIFDLAKSRIFRISGSHISVLADLSNQRPVPRPVPNVLAGRDEAIHVSHAQIRAATEKSLGDLHEGFGYGNLADHEVLTFVDNHDIQRWGTSVSYKEASIYKMAVGFHLAWTYGYPRIVSSYDFATQDQGPPSSGDPNYETKSPEYNPDGTCKQESGWVCEHRWLEIRHLAKFRSDVAGSAVAAIHKETHVLAFARLGKGYFAGNNDDVDRKLDNVDTTLPPGKYCDVYLSAVYDGGKCGNNQVISVDSEGKATFTIKKKSIVAFTLKSATSPVQEPPKVDHKDWKRTVIFLKKETQPGENVFIRGGDSTKEGCEAAPSKDNKCTIPIEHVTAIDVESDVYPSTVYSAYQQWKQGDGYLDFKESEARQGTHDGVPASGTPLIWTTNSVGNPAFNKLNADHNLGDSYWMVELLMDCSSHDTFDFKGVLNGVWENDIPSKDPPCSNGKNHVGRCGAVNIFKWNESACQIVDKK
ncbi:alpha amylase, catalytic domain-containing protein [Ditylenchus destructor]|uniref:Alpha-amylase n=1 Tax=Ditylenchus destructor TaxID=166010 RepID=A0AAD4MRB1_9BILA|nr:alpha amylase, catalytic domain-containing protein [Ditylenchus destructor]